MYVSCVTDDAHVYVMCVGVTDLNRTKEFAAFVAAGCLGMAAGPFGTTLLGWCAFSVGNITFDQITGPGERHAMQHGCLQHASHVCVHVTSCMTCMCLA